MFNSWQNLLQPKPEKRHKSNWYSSGAGRRFGEQKRWGHLFYLASGWMQRVKKGQRNILDLDCAGTFFTVYAQTQWGEAMPDTSITIRELEGNKNCTKPLTILSFLRENKSMCTCYTYSIVHTHRHTMDLFLTALVIMEERQTWLRRGRMCVFFPFYYI